MIDSNDHGGVGRSAAEMVPALVGWALHAITLNTLIGISTLILLALQISRELRRRKRELDRDDDE